MSAVCFFCKISLSGQYFHKFRAISLFFSKFLSTKPFVTGENCDNITTLKKFTLVEALRLCTGHMAHRGSRGIALPFHDYGTRRG
jgi:hypothetical protein